MAHRYCVEFLPYPLQYGGGGDKMAVDNLLNEKAPEWEFVESLPHGSGRMFVFRHRED
ncbi:MAG: hypothetical protein ACLQNG_01765 [Acidimicrobiales bacterium]|jgi:hypothetical protein